MKPSQNFFDLVEHFEGCKLTAYQDIAGVWTIGYGTTHYLNGTRVKEGDTCTLDNAKALLYNGIRTASIPPMEQSQYDACLDFIYNAGQGAFNSSSLKMGIEMNADADSITEYFCMWDKAHVNGKLVEVKGLLRRRKCEAYLFNNGENHPTFYL